LRLHLAERFDSSTGYRGVAKHGNRFQARVTRDGKHIYLGTFDTAVEAAVAYARAMQSPQPSAAASQPSAAAPQLGKRSSPAKRKRMESFGGGSEGVVADELAAFKRRSALSGDNL